MSFFDSIRELLGGAGEHVSNAAQDAASQIPGADQAQDVVDQVNQAKETVLPGDESNDEQ